MAGEATVAPYDPDDKESILDYASKLTGRTLREIGVKLRKGEADFGKSAKGYFGQVLEEGFFRFDNNDDPDPDFASVGMELKSSPMVKRKGMYSAKERLVLSIINYMAVPTLRWDMFYHKDRDLLIVFYEWQKAKSYLDYRILKTTEWTYTDEDMRVIREDWGIIESYILKGRAEELSERLTHYLAACTKGVGHGKDHRQQPFSNVKAKQRALSLKSSYMTEVFRRSVDLSERRYRKAAADPDVQPIDMTGWSETQTFEERILSRFRSFVGMTCGEIQKATGCEDMGTSDKGYYATIARRMLGVRTKKVEQFEKADIQMKTVRLKADGVPKESMSFPYVRPEDILATSEWEDSMVFETFDRRFLIPVFQMTQNGREDRMTTRFLGAFFWAIPYEDFDELRSLWEAVRTAVAVSDVKTLSHKMSVGERFHIRPHGANKLDAVQLPDGREVTKFCFWLSQGYIGDVVRRNLRPRPRASGSEKCGQPPSVGTLFKRTVPFAAYDREDVGRTCDRFEADGHQASSQHLRNHRGHNRVPVPRRP